ncbi:hypothetical protein A9259_08045 [Vibrio cyclitrophicus]|uniref:hypothetical protein n=1 Tax=Vibrio cyclitrophicus TaxID=47951 RepID=UPI0007EE97A7|nr:hypothetical protein [Vibrio cyclitrophicus]OBS98400.1 hypothetical protein A9259_08045 [Vibrio cyclitrophicus]
MLKSYLFSATDKSLFDALNTSKIKNSQLRDLFLSRGVIISTETSREELAKNFSKYNHDYYDHQVIASAMGVRPQREKQTSSEYITELSKDSLESAINKLKNKINSEQDLCIWSEKDKVITIDVTYQTLDYSKSEFKQVVKKEATLTIEKTDDGYNIRYPVNPNVKEYEQYLRNELEKESKKDEVEFDLNNINLFSVDDPLLRTDFFINLIKNMSNFKLKDVTDVYVYHPKPENKAKIKDKDGKDGKDGETNSEIHISRASLKGEGVLKSGEIQELYARGFYISKIRWKFEESLIDSDIYEAEAQFDNPKDFTAFSYITRGKYKYQKKGQYNKNPVKLDDEEEMKITKVIESSARVSADGIIKAVNAAKNATKFVVKGGDNNESSKSEVISTTNEK